MSAPTGPTTAAWAIADAVRHLNHATFGGAGYDWPSDVASVIGAVATAVQLLPQTLDQASRWLMTEHTAGRVGHDRGSDPVNAVLEITDGLTAVVELLRQIEDFLADAWVESSHLTGTTGGGDD